MTPLHYVTKWISDRSKWTWAWLGIIFLWCSVGLWIWISTTSMIVSTCSAHHKDCNEAGGMPIFLAVFLGVVAIPLTIWVGWGYEERVIKKRKPDYANIRAFEEELGLK